MTTHNQLTRFQRSAHALSTDELRRAAPSIFATDAMAGMSSRYAFIPTAAIVDGLRTHDFLPIRAAEGKARLESRREYMRHIIVFRRRSDIDAPAVVGGMVPEIVLDNSHDGSGAYRLMAGLFRFICSNGMIVADSTFAAHSVRHVGAATAGKVIDAAFHVMEEAPKLIETSARWGAIPMNDSQQRMFAHAAAEIRWPLDDANNSTAPIEPTRLLQAQRFDDKKPDLWHTFNRVQENLIRGGLAGRTSTGRRHTTRAINAPAENVRTNRRLWELAEAIAKAATAPAHAAAAE